MQDQGKVIGDGASGSAGSLQPRESASSADHLFDFSESPLAALAWLGAALFSTIAMLAGSPLWLPLLVALVFLYWAWLAFDRSGQRLRVYTDRMELAPVRVRFGGRLADGQRLQVPFAEVIGIDLRGPGIRVERCGELPSVTLLEGLSSKKKHQFHHLFELQQRQGLIPASIGFQDPGVVSPPELLRIAFSGVMILWLLQALRSL